MINDQKAKQVLLKSTTPNKSDFTKQTSSAHISALKATADNSTSGDVEPLNSNGIETGTITTSGGYAIYGTVATSDEDYSAYMQFTQSENCYLEIVAADTSTGNIISSSTSNLANSQYQQTRVRASAGNTVYFIIQDDNTTSPNIDYTLVVNAITNVTDSNEPNDNVLDSLNYTAQPTNTTINANFDNPYDTDCYKIRSVTSSFLSINFTATNEDVSDIYYFVYKQDQSTGGLDYLYSGQGSVPQFTALAGTTYIVEAMSYTGSDYSYTVNFTTSSNGVQDINEPDNSISSPAYLVLNHNKTNPDGSLGYEMQDFWGTLYDPFSTTNPYYDEDDYKVDLIKGNNMEFYLTPPVNGAYNLDMVVYQLDGNGNIAETINPVSGYWGNSKFCRVQVPTDAPDTTYIIHITPSSGDVLNSTTATNDSYMLTIGETTDVDGYYKYHVW